MRNYMVCSFVLVSCNIQQLGFRMIYRICEQCFPLLAENNYIYIYVCAKF